MDFLVSFLCFKLYKYISIVLIGQIFADKLVFEEFVFGQFAPPGSHAVINTQSLIMPLKSWGVLTSFVNNCEIRPSLCYKIILEQREERNQLNT